MAYIPTAWSFLNEQRRGTLSNAFAKFSSITSVCPPQPISDVRSQITDNIIICVSQYNLFTKAVLGVIKFKYVVRFKVSAN